MTGERGYFGERAPDLVEDLGANDPARGVDPFAIPANRIGEAEAAPTKYWFATFGHGQTHPLTGEELVYCYTRVPGATYREAHALMMRTVFGQEWAFLYEDADGRHGAGVERFNLRETPFIAPSPMSDAVWKAYEELGNPDRPDRWVEAVSQPVELAWYRSVADVERAAVDIAMATARRAVDSALSADRFATEDERRLVAAAALTPDADELPAADRPQSPVEPAEAIPEINDRSLPPQVAQHPEAGDA